MQGIIFTLCNFINLLSIFHIPNNYNHEHILALFCSFLFVPLRKPLLLFSLLEFWECNPSLFGTKKRAIFCKSHCDFLVMCKWDAFQFYTISNKMFKQISLLAFSNDTINMNTKNEWVMIDSTYYLQPYQQLQTVDIPDSELWDLWSLPFLCQCL